MYKPPILLDLAPKQAASNIISPPPTHRPITKRPSTQGNRISSIIKSLEAKKPPAPEQSRRSFRDSQAGSWRKSSRDTGVEGGTTLKSRFIVSGESGMVAESNTTAHKGWERRSETERKRGEFYNRASLSVSVSPARGSGIEESQRPNPFRRRDSSGSEVHHSKPTSRRNSLSRQAFERVRALSPPQPNAALSPLQAPARDTLQNQDDTIEGYIMRRLSERWSVSRTGTAIHSPPPTPIPFPGKHVDATFVLDILRTIDHILTDHTATLKAVIAQSEDLLREKEHNCLDESCVPVVHSPQPLPPLVAAVLSHSPSSITTSGAASTRLEGSDAISPRPTPDPSISAAQPRPKRQRSVSGSPIRISPLRIRVPVTQQPLQTRSTIIGNKISSPQLTNVPDYLKPQLPSPQPFIRLIHPHDPSPTDTPDTRNGQHVAPLTAQRDRSSDQVWQSPSPSLLEYDRDAALAARASFQPLISDPSSAGVERRSSAIMAKTPPLPTTRSITPFTKPKPPSPPPLLRDTEQREYEAEDEGEGQRGTPEMGFVRQSTSRNSKAVKGVAGGWSTQRPVVTGEVRPLYEPVSRSRVGSAKRFWGRVGKAKGKSKGEWIE